MSNDAGWNSSQFPEKHLGFLTLEIPAESPLERSELWEISSTNGSMSRNSNINLVLAKSNFSSPTFLSLSTDLLLF